MKHIVICALLVIAQLGLAQEASKLPTGLESITDFSRLPLLPDEVWFHSVSSQDVTGGNDDGFSGAFSYQYIENGRWVLLDTRGPGCVTLIRVIHHDRWNGTLWIRTRRQGKENIDTLPFREIFTGQRPPFLTPLVGDEDEVHGSSWSHVPICSEDGIKLSTDKPGLFLNVYYDSFGPSLPVAAYSASMDVTPAIKRWTSVGAPLDPRPSVSTEREVSLPAGTTVPVWQSSEPGTITGLYIRAPEMTHRLLRHVRLRAYWDGQEEAAVDSPLGPFFGTGYWPVPDPAGAPVRYGLVNSHGVGVRLGRIATRSLPVGAGQDGFYSLFPMPFYHSARIELRNESGTLVDHLKVVVNFVSGGPDPHDGYFHAQWREENPTIVHRDYTVLETRGHGRFMGAVLILSSVRFNPAQKRPGQRGYLEGDARFYIDDNRTFANASTGTEEYFLWGFYDIARWDSVFSYPVNGYPVHDTDSEDNSVMYRFHLGDMVPYYRSFRFALEHGGEGAGNEAAQPSHYSGTAFYYQREQPVLSMTDKLVIGDDSSRAAHAYRAQKITWKGCRDLPFEGDRQALFTRAYIADSKEGTRESLAETLSVCGQRVAGSVEFTATILPDNRGVKIRRLLDYSPANIPGQELAERLQPLVMPAEVAHVFVDGKDAGEWYTGPRHARLAWLEDDFELPASLTSRKSHLQVRLKVPSGSLWSAFEYRVYTYRAGQ